MRTDVFGLTPRQHDLFDATEPASDQPMTAADIRDELTRTLVTLRAAAAMPWPPRRMLETVTMFPELAARLPGDEGAALATAFEAEMRRLRASG